MRLCRYLSQFIGREMVLLKSSADSPPLTKCSPALWARHISSPLASPQTQPSNQMKHRPSPWLHQLIHTSVPLQFSCPSCSFPLANLKVLWAPTKMLNPRDTFPDFPYGARSPYSLFTHCSSFYCNTAQYIYNALSGVPFPLDCELPKGKRHACLI